MLASGKMVPFPLVISRPWHYTESRGREAGKLVLWRVKVREEGERLPL